MTDAKLKEIRLKATQFKEKNPKCAAVILELLEHIDKLKYPRADPESVSLLKQKAKLWFKCRDTKEFDSSELRAIKGATLRNIGETDLDNLDWWYAMKEEECFQKFGTGRRKTIASLFNNIGMEILKAEQARAKTPQHKPKTQPHPINLAKYLSWLDAQGYGERMRPEWRDPATAPKVVVDEFLENDKL